MGGRPLQQQSYWSLPLSLVNELRVFPINAAKISPVIILQTDYS
jgi:hypothetical protein